MFTQFAIDKLNDPADPAEYLEYQLIDVSYDGQLALFTDEREEQVNGSDVAIYSVYDLRRGCWLVEDVLPGAAMIQDPTHWLARGWGDSNWHFSLSGDGNWVTYHYDFWAGQSLDHSRIARQELDRSAPCGEGLLGDEEVIVDNPFGVGQHVNFLGFPRVNVDGSAVTYGACDRYGESGCNVFLFVDDGQSTSITEVALDNDDVPIRWSTWAPAIAGDGETVAFMAYADDVGDGLVATPGVERHDLFVRDLDAGSTVRIPAPSAWTPSATGPQPIPHSGGPVPTLVEVSHDGRFVLFMARHPDHQSWMPVVFDRDVNESGTFDEAGHIDSFEIDLGFSAQEWDDNEVWHWWWYPYWQTWPSPRDVRLSPDGATVVARTGRSDANGDMESELRFHDIATDTVHVEQLPVLSDGWWEEDDWAMGGGYPQLAGIGTPYGGDGAVFTDVLPLADGDVNGTIDIYTLGNRPLFEFAWGFGSFWPTSDAGDPVNTTTGNLWETRADVSSAGHVFGVAFGRTFNMLDAMAGDVGGRWANSYGQQIWLDGDDVNVDDVVIRDADGRHLVFEPDGQGGWSQPASFDGELSTVSFSGGVVTAATAEFDDGSSWEFVDGWLVEMDNGDGQSVTVTRGSEGELVSVVNSPYGFALQFDTAADGLVETVWPGQVITSGTAAHGLPGAAGAGPLIDEVFVADGRRVDFSYHELADGSRTLASASAPYFDLSGEPHGVEFYDIDSNGRIVEMRVEGVNYPQGLEPDPVVLLEAEYYGNGRARSQVSADGDLVTFEYDDALSHTTVTWGAHHEDPADRLVMVYQWSTAGFTTVIEDPYGQSVERGFTDRGDMDDVTDRSGVRSRAFYDGEGRLLQRAIPDPDPGDPDQIPDPDPQAGWTRDPEAGWSLEEYEYVGPGDHRVELHTNAEEEVTRFVYDGGSRRVTERTIGYGTGEAATTSAVYDDDGRVVREVDADGVATFFEYDDVGNLVRSVTDSNLPGDLGSYDPDQSSTAMITELSYTPQGWLESVTTPEGHTTSYEYYGTGKVRFVADPLTDPLGGLGGSGHVPAERLWAPDGSLLYSSDAEGLVTTRSVDREPDSGTYGAEAARVETTSSDGQPTEVAIFDASDDLIEQWVGEPGDWAVTTYSYGPLGRLESSTGPDGVVRNHLYDVEGRVWATFTGPYSGEHHGLTELSGGVEEWLETLTLFDRAGRPAVEEGPTGDVDHNGDPIRQRVRYEYDRVGRVTAVIDEPLIDGVVTGDPRVRRTAYDELGRGSLRWLDLADSGERDDGDPATRTHYTPAGRVAEVVTPRPGLLEADLEDPDEVAVISFAYDDAGRKVAETDPEDRTTTWEYDLDGNVELVTSPAGRTLLTEHDPLGRAWRTETVSPADDNEVVQVLRSFDAGGRLIAETDPHDPSEVSPPTREFAYTNGQLSSVVDARGIETTYEHDVRGNVTKRTAVAEMDGSTPVDFAEQTWTYDAAGRVVTATDPLDRTTEWRYDDDPGAPAGHPRGLLWQMEQPSGRVESFSWDSHGRLASRVAEHGSDEVIVEQVYDAFGNRVLARTGDDPQALEEWTYDFDNQGRLLEVTYPNDQVSWSNTYDLTGNRVALGYHVSLFTEPVVEMFDYDRSGRVVESNISDMDSQSSTNVYGYDDDGLLVSHITNGVWPRYWNYSSSGHLTGYIMPDDLGIAEYELSWRSDGRLGAVDVDASQSWEEVYGYDLAGQLELVERDEGSGLETTTVTYGSRGERLEVDKDNQKVTYTYDEALQVLSAFDSDSQDTIAFFYDQDGRRVVEELDPASDPLREIEYDPAGRPSSITRDPGPGPFGAPQTVSRGYDPDGNLAYVNNVPHVWDTTRAVPRWLGNVANDENWERAHWGPSGLETRASIFGLMFGWFYSFPSTDHLGSALDSHVDHFSPWGEPNKEGSSRTNAPAYLGYRSELHLDGLIHLRNRDYDPATGVFTTPDPLDGVDGTPTVANPYHYADNDPLNKIDPLGLRPTEGPCSEFSSTGAVIDAQTCESALDLWEKRDRSTTDCAAVGGVNYDAGTCYVPPQSRDQRDFCFPPVRGDDIMSLGPNGTCGVWGTEIQCARFSNPVTDPICRRRVGILKVAGYALIPAAIAVTVGTGGLAASPSAGAILAVTSGSLHISAEVLDGKPCRSQRVTVTAVLTILGGGVGGAFSSGGLVVGEAATQAGLAGLESVEFSC